MRTFERSNVRTLERSNITKITLALSGVVIACHYSAIVVFAPPSFAAAKNMFSMPFGRTDLRIILSRTKLAEEPDFDVRFAVALQNPHQIGKNQISGSNKIRRKSSFSIEKRNVANVPKHDLANLRDDRNLFRSINSRSNFEKLP